jgi:hypothetical protein
LVDVCREKWAFRVSVVLKFDDGDQGQYS